MKNGILGNEFVRTGREIWNVRTGRDLSIQKGGMESISIKCTLIL